MSRRTQRTQPNPTPQKSWSTYMVIGAVVVSVLYLWLDPFAAAIVDKPAIEYLAEIDAPLRKSKPMVFSGTPDANAYGSLQRKVSSTARILTGDVVMRLPRTALIELETIAETEAGELLMKFNATLREALEAHGLHAQMLSSAVYAMFLAMDRYNASSPHAAFWALLPPAAVMYPPLFWTEADVACFDGNVRSDVQTVRLMLPAIERGIAEICELTTCAREWGAEEIQWGLAAYYALNVRQQLIAPALGFFRRSSQRSNANLASSHDTNTLDIVVGRQVKEGGEIALPVERDATYQISTTGAFDPQTAAVEVPIPYAVMSRDAFMRKHCLDAYSAIVIKSDGRPSAALLRCMAAITASASQKVNIAQYEHDEPWMKMIDERIVELVTGLNDTLAKLPSECPMASPQVFSLQRQYARHMRQTVDHFFIMRRA